MIAVAGASGMLGGLVLDGLLEVVPPGRLVAVARDPEKAARFASRGVFLASDEAGWLTGAWIPASGGLQSAVA